MLHKILIINTLHYCNLPIIDHGIYKLLKKKNEKFYLSP